MEKLIADLRDENMIMNSWYSKFESNTTPIMGGLLGALIGVAKEWYCSLDQKYFYCFKIKNAFSYKGIKKETIKKILLKDITKIVWKPKSFQGYFIIEYLGGKISGILTGNETEKGNFKSMLQYMKQNYKIPVKGYFYEKEVNIEMDKKEQDYLNLDNTPLPDECPSCFHKITKEDTYCTYCGHQLEQKIEEDKYQSVRKTVKRVDSEDYSREFVEDEEEKDMKVIVTPNDTYWEYVLFNQKNEMRNRRMTKADACRACKDNGINTKYYIVTFATANKSFTHLYWANPRIEVLNEDWILILNDNLKEILHVFKIPCGEIDLDELKVRSDDYGRLDLQIFYNDKTFTCSRSGFSFKPYFVKSIKY